MPVPNNTTNKNEEEEEELDLPPPPDGGWGWAIVFGSFMIHIITDGVTYSFGVFYDEFLTYFNEGKGATSWIVSILVGVTLCSGPISSALVNKWGCRPVTIAGAILASVCMIISCWAQNVTTLYFTIGIGTGFGFGLIYLPAIVSVTTYFEKKRSLATGIAVCGSGFGTFIFAPIINLLLVEYGWRGAMLIISAIVLECILFGALFRPLEYSMRVVPVQDREAIVDDVGISLKSTDAKTDIHISDNHLPSLATRNDGAKIQIQRPRSMGHFTIPLPVKSTNLEKNGNIPGDKFKTTEISRLAFSHPVLSTQSDSGRHHHDLQNFKRSTRPLNRPDVFYQGSLINIPQYRSRSNMKNTEETDLMMRRLSNSSRMRHSHRTEESESTICGIVPCSEDTKETLKEMLDFSLFKDPIFIIFIVSNFFTSIGFYIPYVYIVSKAKTLDISPENASMLLSVIGIANTVGRIILGYVSDNPKINRLLVYNLCLTICGIATTFSAFCLDFYSLAVYGCVFGFTIGAYVGLTSVILVDLLGLDKLTNAFGLLLLFQGIASLVGPPIAGEMYDVLDSYDPGFYMSGITIAASGIMLFAIPPMQRWQQRKKVANKQNKE